MQDLKQFVNSNLDEIVKSKPLYSGKSKLIYKVSERYCLVELIPSLTSFTYKRNELIKGTEKLRLDFYDLAIEQLKKNGVQTAYEYRISENRYLAEICSNPPFEVIVKNRAVGSTQIKYPGLFPKKYKFKQPIVKFDYRIDPEDTPIAEDYIREYGLDPKKLREMALATNQILSEWLSPLELYDFCIIVGVDKDGEYKITSEISPDGMRLKSKNNESYDKDIFRQGGGSKEIIKAWEELIKFIKTK